MIPVKALKWGDLELSNAKVAASGHEVQKCHLLDESGKERLAFFKPLDPTYPPMLAKLCVAIGVVARLSLGEFAADTRLVYDESGTKVIGTVSFALDNMVTMQVSGEPDELDPEKALLKNPNVAYLMENNITRILVALWRHKDDDSHPGNVSFQGIFDYDMFYYNLTHILKGLRWISGMLQKLPEKDTKICVEDIHTFPEYEGRTHSPTNAIPGNYNLYKIFKNREEFLKLKSNPKILSGSDETISFHEQFYSAMLNELLSFQPDVLKARLNAYLGNEKVSFSDIVLNSEDEPIDTKKASLQDTFPSLFSGFEEGNYYKRAFSAIIDQLTSNLPQQLAVKIHNHLEEEEGKEDSFEKKKVNREIALPEIFHNTNEDNSELTITKSMLKGILSCPPRNLKQLFQNYLKEHPKTDCTTGEKSPEQIKVQIIESMLPLFEYSYVDLCSAFFSSEYQELYNTIVHYQGHSHEEEVEVEADGLLKKQTITVENPSFCGFLNCKPSAFQDIKAMYEQRNAKLIREKEQTLKKELSKIDKLERSRIANVTVENKKALNRALKDCEDTQKIKQEYAQELEQAITNIEQECASQREYAQQCFEKVYSSDQLYDIDKLMTQYHILYRESFTHKLKHYFDRLEDLEKAVEIQYNSDRSLEDTFQKIQQLRNHLRDVTNRYYYEQPEPTNEINSQFRKQVLEILNDIVLSEIQNGLKNKDDIQEFTEIFSSFKEIISDLNIIVHQASKDKELGDKKSSFKNIQYKCQTDPVVIHSFIDSLFKWVDETYINDKETFHGIIDEIIQSYEKGGYKIFSSRARKGPTLTYLKDSKWETPGEQLAHILSIGSVESTSLNPLIIKTLAKLMVESREFTSDITVNLRALSAILNGKNPESFDARLYAEKTQEHIRSNDAFNYIYADSTLAKALPLFYEWMEEGLQDSDSIKKEITKLEQELKEIKGVSYQDESHRENIRKQLVEKREFFNTSVYTMIIKTLELYQQESSYSARDPEIRKLFNTNAPSGKNFLLAVFKTGGTKETSYNTIAFKHLFMQMVSQKCSEPGLGFLKRYSHSKVDWTVLASKVQRDALLRSAQESQVETADQESTKLTKREPLKKALSAKPDSVNKIESYDAEKDIEILQELLCCWANKNVVKFNTLYAESLDEYENAAAMTTKFLNYLWSTGSYKPTRSKELCTIQSLAKTPKQKLIMVYQNEDGGTNENSFNTILYKKLFKEFVKERKGFPNYEILESFNEKTFPWDAHLDILNKNSSKAQKTSYSYSRIDVDSQQKTIGAIL